MLIDTNAKIVEVIKEENLLYVLTIDNIITIDK